MKAMISFRALSHNPLRYRNHSGKKIRCWAEVTTFFRAPNLQNELSKELKTTTNHRTSCSNCIRPCLSKNNKKKCAGWYTTKSNCCRRPAPEGWLAGHIMACMPTTAAKHGGCVEQTTLPKSATRRSGRLCKQQIH